MSTETYYYAIVAAEDIKPMHLCPLKRNSHFSPRWNLAASQAILENCGACKRSCVLEGHALYSADEIAAIIADPANGWIVAPE